MKVLVIGKGGREHALCWKLKQSPRVRAVFCAPGNAGTALEAQNVSIEPNDTRGLIQFARAVVPGSARIIAGTGDDRNALIMLTVEADFGAGKVTPGRMIAGTASAPKGANEGRQRPAHTQPRRGERREPRNLRRRGRFQPWRENIPLNTIQGAAASGASGSWPPDRGRDHHEIAEDHRTADELAEVMRHYLW